MDEQSRARGRLSFRAAGHRHGVGDRIRHRAHRVLAAWLGIGLGLGLGLGLGFGFGFGFGFGLGLGLGSGLDASRQPLARGIFRSQACL